MTKPGDTPRALLALLDALEAEILGAPVEELRQALRGTARSPDAAGREVRSILDAAMKIHDEGSSPTIPRAMRDGTGLRRH